MNPTFTKTSEFSPHLTMLVPKIDSDRSADLRSQVQACRVAADVQPVRIDQSDRLVRCRYRPQDAMALVQAGLNERIPVASKLLDDLMTL